MAWLSRNDFTGSDYVQASDLNNLHDDIVTWGGNVNGGGFTLSNVVLAGVITQGAAGVSSFNNRTGAVMPQAGDYTAAMVGAVATTLQILTPIGSGLSGGGPLTGNLSLSADMLSFNGRKGAVTLTPADITGAMGVVQARAINSGAGLQGGGNLGGDLTLSVIPGDATQQIQFFQGGGMVATRHAVNFISGANVTVAVTDNSSAGRVDVTISSTGGGSGMVDPTTTKGDLIVRGAGITARLGVGTDGQVLTADSTQSLGLRWSAASGSGAVASVFGRTGPVVAATGDYNAAQVTNAVDRSQTYSDPMWLTGLNWSKILGAPAFLLDPTTTKGDLLVHGAAAITRLPIGGDGTMLVADSTQALGVRWGASPSAIPAGQYAGDLLVWQQAGAWGLLSAAGQPAAVGNVLTVQSTGASTKLAWQAPPPQQPTSYFVNGTLVQTAFGLNIVAGNNTTVTGALDGSGTKVNITVTAGGPTSGLADPTTTKGDLIARSSSQVTRLPIGTDGTVLMADSTQALGMKWATVSGGGGGAQTPWTSNIDAAGYTLSNIPVIQAPASNNNLILNAPGAGGSISLQADGTTMATVNNTAGLIVWGSVTANVNVFNQNPPAVILAGYGTAQWDITGTASPTTPGTNLLTFQCFQQTAAIYTMNDLGYFGVGVAAPAYAVDVAGDCNITGVYRVHGTQLAAAQVVNAVSQIGSYANPAWITSLAWSKLTGVPSTASFQTPWVSDIDGATHILKNVGQISIGTAMSPLATLHVHVAANQNLLVGGMGWLLSGAVGLNAANDANNAGIPMAYAASLHTFAGNVGIASTAPKALLQVGATSDSTWDSDEVILPGVLQCAGYSASNPNVFFQAHDSSGVNSIGFRFRTSVSGAMRDVIQINPNGSVGLNTNTPLSGALLHVENGVTWLHTTVGTGGMWIGDSGGPTIQVINDAWTAYVPLKIYAQATTFMQGNLNVGAAGVSWASGSLNIIGGRSYLYANSEPFSIGLAYAPGSTGGTYIGTNSSQAFQVSASTGVAILTIDQTGNANFAGKITTPVGLTCVGIQTTGQLFACSNVVASDFANGALQIRETNQTDGSSSGDNRYAPRIGFHWAGIVASQLGMDNAGNIRTFDNPGTGFAPFLCYRLGTMGALYQNSHITVIPATDPSSQATAAQICIGEHSANTAYRLQIGYYNEPSTGVWSGVIQNYHANAPYDLFINPQGGPVKMGIAGGADVIVNTRLVCGVGAGGQYGDVCVGRPNAPTTGTVYFGNSGGVYIYYDGTNFNFTRPVSAPGYIGGGVTVQQKPSRGIGSIYQNATGKPMFVVVTALVAGAGALIAYTDSSSNPQTQVAYVGGSAQAQPQASVNLCFWVLPGNYYALYNSAGAGWSSAVGMWTEWY